MVLLLFSRPNENLPIFEASKRKSNQSTADEHITPLRHINEIALA
jgi:hypothetical protein